MKTILFDLFEAQPTSTSKFHGGGEYIKAVFKNLTEKFWEQCKLIVFYDKERFLDQWILDIIYEKNIERFFVKNIKDVSEVFKKYNIDIFYSGLPYYYKKDMFPSNIRIKTTIHGLRFLELPSDKYANMYGKGKANIKEFIRHLMRKFYQEKKKREFKSCIELSDDLVCVSNHTKYSIAYYYPQFKNKEMRVFYTPQKSAGFCKNNSGEIDGKYILILGGDRWVKNCYREILAFENLFKRGYLQDYRIVVVGGLSRKIRKTITYVRNYLIMDYVEIDKLESLYKHCDIFLYASLNEGFGMPPLEAMKYGRTCIISGVCSLPEICGDAVYYVNPYNIDEIASRILNGITTKIPVEKVIAQFNKIYERQKNDLDQLCEFIIE